MTPRDNDVVVPDRGGKEITPDQRRIVERQPRLEFRQGLLVARRFLHALRLVEMTKKKDSFAALGMTGKNGRKDNV